MTVRQEGKVKQSMEQDRKKFKSFVPRQDVDLGIYKDALDYAIKNDEIKNIGIIGPYGAGKSSIIETYKVQNPKNVILEIEELLENK